MNGKEKSRIMKISLRENGKIIKSEVVSGLKKNSVQKEEDESAR